MLALSPELLSHIFSFLPEDRLDIASCRLVSHTFKDLSSPFLIPSVVFANRLKTIEHLHEVIAHPYCSRYVRELLFDASSYKRELAQDRASYDRACYEALRCFYDDELMANYQEDSATWQRLGEYAGPPLNPDDSDPDEASLQEMQKEYLCGYHRGHADYQARYLAQVQLSDAKVPRNVLKKAFESLPKLRRVVSGDYRNLCREGESDSQCCRRLFGNTLEPELDVRGDAFPLLLEAISTTPGRGLNLSQLAHTFSSRGGRFSCKPLMRVTSLGQTGRSSYTAPPSPLPHFPTCVPSRFPYRLQDCLDLVRS